MSDDVPITNDQLVTLVRELVELRKLLAELRNDNKALLEELRRKNREISELEDQLEDAEREGKRQAAPFRRRDSRKKHRSRHRRSGRKQGHPGSRRERPDDIAVDHTHEVELCECPECGSSELSDFKELEQFVEDIDVRRVVHRVTTHSAHCAECGRVRSRHPLQVSEATGAAGVQIGPNALALGLDLNKRLGLSLRKTTDVLECHGGLSLSPGGLVQASHRLAGRLEDDYKGLIDELRKRAAVYVDETSWWVGEAGWWLWGFTDDQDITFYTVENRRNREVVEEILGEDFEGILSSDCLNIYDNHEYTQNKCYAHHLRAISKALRRRPESDYLREVQQLLTRALAAQPDADKDIDHDVTRRFELWAQRLLSPPRTDEVEQKVRNRLRKQQEHLFTFLSHPAVDATNNAAERALRPGVIARKISCGNRTIQGKKTWEILASLAATYKRRGKDFADLIRSTARPPPASSHATPN